MNSKAVRLLLPVLVLLFSVAAIPVVSAQEPAKSSSTSGDKKLNALIKKAEQGDAQAQNTLGVMYDIGLGVQQDNAEAVKWYRKAAEQGYASAQYNLGLMYDNGQGVQKDNAEAVKWYRKAAEQGVATAQFTLMAKAYRRTTRQL